MKRLLPNPTLGLAQGLATAAFLFFMILWPTPEPVPVPVPVPLPPLPAVVDVPVELVERDVDSRSAEEAPQSPGPISEDPRHLTQNDGPGEFRAPDTSPDHEEAVEPLPTTQLEAEWAEIVSFVRRNEARVGVYKHGSGLIGVFDFEANQITAIDNPEAYSPNTLELTSGVPNWPREHGTPLLLLRKEDALALDEALRLACARAGLEPSSSVDTVVGLSSSTKEPFVARVVDSRADGAK